MTAPLVARRKVIEAGLESTPGTAQFGTTTAILAFEPKIEMSPEFIERKPVAKHGGHIQGYLASRVGKISFKTELRGSGSSTTFDPAIALLLQCCGLQLTGGVYAPATPADQKTCSIAIYEDGTLKKFRGCAGDFTIEGEYGKPAYINFEMSGVWDSFADASMPTVTHSSVIAPRVELCAFSYDSESLRASKFTFKPGGKVEPVEDINAAEGVLHYFVADRDPTITIDPEMRTAADWDMYDHFLGLGQAAFTLTIGTVTNNKCTLAAPTGQIRQISESERGNKLANELTIQPNCSGGDDDDDFSITPG